MNSSFDAYLWFFRIINENTISLDGLLKDGNNCSLFGANADFVRNFIKNMLRKPFGCKSWNNDNNYNSSTIWYNVMTLWIINHYDNITNVYKRFNMKFLKQLRVLFTFKATSFKISVRFQSLLTSSVSTCHSGVLPKTQSLLKLQHFAFAKLSILLDHVTGGPNAKLTPFEYCNLPGFDHLPIASLQRLIAVGREVFLLCLESSLWFDRLNPKKRHPKSQSFQSRFWWRSAC